MPRFPQVGKLTGIINLINPNTVRALTLVLQISTPGNFNREGLLSQVLPFHPESELVDARAKIRQAVDIVLEKLQAGILPDDIELGHEAVLNGLVHRLDACRPSQDHVGTGRLRHASDQSRRFHRRHHRRDCASPTVRPPPGLG